MYSKTNVWSVGDDYILKMSNSEEDIKHKIYVSQLLLNEGIPVPKVIGSLEGNTYIKINNKFYALFTKLKVKPYLIIIRAIILQEHII